MRHILMRLVAAASLIFVIQNLSANEIAIGQVVPLSGPVSSTGKELAFGAKVYFDSLNQRGGINGRKIRHVVKDDGYQASETVRQVQELIEKEKVIGLVGLAGTGNILELIKHDLLAKHKMPLVAPFTGSEQLRAPYNPNIFHIRASYGEEVERMVEQLVNVGMTKVAVFYQNDPFGHSGLKDIEEALSRRNLKIAALGSYEKLNKDVAGAVSAIEKDRPAAVLMAAVTGSAAAFLKEYRKQNPATPVLGISVINGKEVFDIAGPDAARGLGITQVVPSPHNEALPVVREFRSALQKYGQGATPNHTNFEGYLGAMVVAEGLKRIKGEVTSGALLNALETVVLDIGAGHKIQFAPQRRNGSSFVQVTLMSKEGGVLK